MVSFQKKYLSYLISSLLTVSSGVSLANETKAEAETKEAAAETGVIEVRGMKLSIKESLFIKQNSIQVVDAIVAEDIGKFPDQNVAESLQRITGVSIDRSGGEGQAVTVRGFGPQFNTVLVNGRQMATDSAGREFNFDILSAEQITGANVYKTTNASMQEGGIGGTIDLTTARPFDYSGLQIVGCAFGNFGPCAHVFGHLQKVG